MNAAGHILVVDDEVRVSNAFRNTLQKDGYDVDIAKSGLEALRRVEEDDYDVVITDEVLPGVDGETLVRHIHSRHPDVQVIVTSVDGSIRRAVRAMKAGAFDVLTKPVAVKELRSAVLRSIREAWRMPRSRNAPAVAGFREEQTRPVPKNQQKDTPVHFDTTTHRETEEILDLATSFFGLDGVGLALCDRTPDCVVLKGCGGYVCVSVSSGGGIQYVNLEARKWNTLTEVFLQTL